MDANDNAGNQMPRSARRFFASKLAPTVIRVARVANRPE